MHHCYFNGTISPVADTTLKINDLGLLRGYSMFDYFRTYNGRPFQWDWYWERFANSAKTLGIPLPITQTQAADILAELYRLAEMPEISYRFVLTGGYSPNSVSMIEPNLLIISENLPQDSPDGYTKGIKLIPYEFVRDLPEVKTTNYLHMIRLAPEMKSQNASDLLYHKDGEISELTRSNFFIFKGNTLITPNRNILHGITRRFVLELAKDEFEIQIRPLKMTELTEATEAFTTSSTKWVMPIVQIGRQIIGDGTPGTNSKHLRTLFQEKVAAF
jgi:branched-chain amino acid aminotransferase